MKLFHIAVPKGLRKGIRQGGGNGGMNISLDWEQLEGGIETLGSSSWEQK